MTQSQTPFIPKITSAAPPSPAAPLQSTFSVLATAGEPVATVRVCNLQTTLPVGRDAWGRSGKTQPVLLSSELSFRSPFAASSADDKLVESETVHYGTLSKTLLSAVDSLSANAPPTTSETDSPSPSPSTPSTAAVQELLWVRLTGRVPDGSKVALPADQVPFLEDASRLRSLSLTISLPKASLLGAGVSLTTTAAFRSREALLGPGGGSGDGDDDKEKKNPLEAYARSLKISGLHVPTLVGVNANEREARQMLIAEVEIDRFHVTSDDVHAQIERVVVDTMSDSAFETLEALGTCIASKILDDFRIPGDSGDDKPMREKGWQVRVLLEKPMAVPFAECPAVEVRMGQGL